MAKENFLKRIFKKISNEPITQPIKQDTQSETNNKIQQSIATINSLLNESFTQLDLSNNNRQYRYHEYELILRRIPEQNRQLSLIQDLVLNPTEINNKYINIVPKTTTFSDIDVTDLEILIEKIKLEEILPRIVFNLLLYGDSFVEIQDSTLYNLDNKLNKYRTLNIVVHDPKDIVVLSKNNETFGYVEIKGVFDTISEDFFDNKGDEYENILKQISELDDQGELITSRDFQFGDEENKLQYRYIPTKYMSHFMLTNNNMYYPYGTSYFEQVRQIQNTLLLIELSTVVYRLVRQPGHIKYKLDVTGIDPTQYPGYIQTMKQMIRSEKQVNPDIGSASLEETVKLVTMFDDYWIPVRNGVPIYDQEWMEGGNLNTQIEDLDYLHKKLLSQLGIPPSYLGFEEPLSGVQTVLVIQDQRVARIINRIQKDINDGLNDLIYKVSNILGTTSYIQNASITLTPVKSQDEDQKLDLLQKKASLLSQLQQFGLNKDFLLKTIMQYTKDEIDEQLIKDENEEEINQDNQEF